MNLWIWFISVLVMIPFLSLPFFYLLLSIKVKSKKKKFLWTADLSTFIFIVAVHFQLITIFQRSFTLHIVFSLLILTLIFLYIDYKKANNVSWKRVTKRTWRFSFFLFIFGYLLLTIIGIASGIVQQNLS
ncbi:DUF3397 domain-containing protein [Metabacillus herbersteinensis]|uniref:DUF3397 domain-containing protein n=1 Tax=Metabacillus herbersteinensis TaxID=283816 RepID=A0ABV6GBZ2_9BACI